MVFGKLSSPRSGGWNMGDTAPLRRGLFLRKHHYVCFLSFSTIFYTTSDSSAHFYETIVLSSVFEGIRAEVTEAATNKAAVRESY